MNNPSRQRGAIRFGPFHADLVAERLLRNGTPVRLQEQPLKLLLLLLERPGEIVSREELRCRLWPEDSYGEFDNGLNVAVRKVRAALGDEAGSPRFIETVPRHGYRFVAEILEEEGEPASAAPLPANSLVGTTKSLASPSGDDPGRGAKLRAVISRRALWILSGVVFSVGLPIAILLLRQRVIPSNAAHIAHRGPARRSVAVLEFQNSSGRSEDAWLSTALSEMFSTELAAGDHLRLISGEDVVHARLGQPLRDVDSLSSNTARQLRKSLDADLIVSGSYAAVNSGNTTLVRLDVRLQDAGSGEILTEVSSTGSEEALFQLVGSAGERLREKLGVSGISPEEYNQVLASMPTNREAGDFTAMASSGFARTMRWRQRPFWSDRLLPTLCFPSPIRHSQTPGHASDTTSTPLTKRKRRSICLPRFCLQKNLQGVQEIPLERVRQFVFEQSDRFSSILQMDRGTAKLALRTHFKPLVLTPTDTPSGPIYSVEGVLDLFAGLEDVMLLAAPQGFEPRYADPESAVLPLNEGAVERDGLMYQKPKPLDSS